MLTDLPEPVAGHAINRHWLTRIDTGLYWGRPVTDHPGMEGMEPWPQDEAEIHVLPPGPAPGRPR